MRHTALLVLATALVAIAGCDRPSPEAIAVENQAEMMADNLEDRANELDAIAGNMANAAAAEEIANASDNLQDEAANVRDDAEDKIDNIR